MLKNDILSTSRVRYGKDSAAASQFRIRHRARDAESLVHNAPKVYTELMFDQQSNTIASRRPDCGVHVGISHSHFVDEF